MEKVKTIATLSDLLDTLAKWFRVMTKGGLQYDKFLIPINKRKERGNLIEYINMGCPKVRQEGSIVKKPAKESDPAILRLISSKEELVLDPTDGQATLAQANDIFAFIDSDLKNWGTDMPGKATSETKVQVYEMAQDATYTKMFISLSPDLGKLCLLQGQIKGFCQKHRQWLRQEGYGTFFLFKVGNKFFVASVGMDSYGRLEVYVYRFDSDRVWSADRGRRVVVPQLQ